MWHLSPPLELDSPKGASALLADLRRATPRARERTGDAVVGAALGAYVFVWRDKRRPACVPRPVFAGRVISRERGSSLRGAFVTPGIALGVAFAASATLVAGAAGLAAALLPSAAIFGFCRFISARLLPADEPLVVATLEAATRASAPASD